MIESLQDLNFLHLFYFWTVVRYSGITAACEHLHLSQPTISTQIRKLEKALGHSLFDRSGRELVLTDVGSTVFEYADDIFSTGREMLGTLRGLPSHKAQRLSVGVPMSVPKLITYRLLEVVLKFPQPVQIDCSEAPLETLLADLARHRHDVIISDVPILSTNGRKSYSHNLGSCSVSFCGVASMAEKLRGDFPASLNRAPMLLPSPHTQLRRTLDQWFDQQDICPMIVAQFDDSAMMKEFGSGGAGVFPIPTAVVPQVCRQYSVGLLGTLDDVHANYYAITAQRKLTHPVVVAISEAAPSILHSMGSGQDATPAASHAENASLSLSAPDEQEAL